MINGYSQQQVSHTDASEYDEEPPSKKAKVIVQDLASSSGYNSRKRAEDNNHQQRLKVQAKLKNFSKYSIAADPTAT